MEGEGVYGTKLDIAIRGERKMEQNKRNVRVTRLNAAEKHDWAVELYMQERAAEGR